MDDAGWKREDVNGKPLLRRNLSGKLTQTAAYRRTISGVFNKRSDVAEYIHRMIEGRTNPHVEAALGHRAALLMAMNSLITNLHPSDFEILIQLIFDTSGWRRVSQVGGQQRTVDFIVENRITVEHAFVQVKSTTDQQEFDGYVRSFKTEMNTYDRMFYVYHTGQIMNSYPDVIVWSINEVSEQVFQNGLCDWLMNKSL